MTIQELIKEKSKRLQGTPDKFLSATEKAQKQIFTELTALLQKLKTNPDGSIKISTENLKIASQINEQLKQVVYGSDYVTAVREFASDFDKVKEINNKYFSKAFPDFTTESIANQIFTDSKRLVVKDLISSTIDSRFLLPIETLLNDSVSSGAGMLDTIKSLRLFVEGGQNANGDLIDGKILRYAKTIAHDAIAVSDASYTDAVANELDAEWYFYDGTEVAGSRCFCLERKGKYFYYKEVESWATESGAGDCGFPWDGYREGTNETTIFQYRGGYGCLDSLMIVSIAIVPMDVIQRNIANGNFVPSQFERDELGL